MTGSSSFHEDLSRARHVNSGSDRSFGIVFAVVFAIISLWPLTGDGSVRWYTLAIAAVFLVIAFVRPGLFGPLNRVWLKLGLVLSRIVNPVVLGVIYFAIITPYAIALRLLGKDLLRLRLDPAARSYWIERKPPGPAPETMKNQF